MTECSNDSRASTPSDTVDSRPAAPGSRTSIVVAAVAFASVLALDPGGWFPFSVAKWWAVVGAVLGSLALVTATADRPWQPFVERSGRRAVMSMLALAAVVTASAVTGVDGVYAWIGTPVRHLGAITWWLFSAMFVAGVMLGSTRSDASFGADGESVRSAAELHENALLETRRVTWMLTLAGLALGIYVFWEAAVGRPVEFASSSDRLAGPFGSSAYLGACSCLLLPVAIGHGCSREVSLFARVIAAMAAIGSMIGAIGSGSRAALLGLGVAGAVAVVVALRERTAIRGDQRRVSEVVVATAIVTFAAGVWLARARGVFERSAGWSTRLDEWALALRVIAQRPLLGHGPEGYRIAAFSAADDDYVRRFGEDTFVDRAHSGILDVAASSGLLAAVLYVAVVFFVVRAAISLIRTGAASERGLGVAVIAYAVGQQFLFPVAEIDPLFWLLAGFVVGRAAARSPRSSSPAARRPSSSDARLVARALTVLFVALALGATVIGTRSVAADRHAADASLTDDRDAAVASSMRAEDLAPLDIRHSLHTAWLSSGLATLNGVDAAIDAAERAASVSPDDPAVRIELARLRALRASVTGDAGDRARAERAWSDLLSDAPSCARCHLGAALAAGERGDVAHARSELERAADLGSPEAIERLR